MNKSYSGWEKRFAQLQAVKSNIKFCYYCCERVYYLCGLRNIANLIFVLF